MLGRGETDFDTCVGGVWSASGAGLYGKTPVGVSASVVCRDEMDGTNHDVVISP